MTEPGPQWSLDATEAELAAEVTKRLREAGWYVIATSQHKSTPQQMRGFPDRVAFRDGVTLLLELKAAGGELNDAQRKFAEAIAPHVGPHLNYGIIRHPAQIELYCREVRSGKDD